ncbi:hypothetical protein [Streptomyces sp. FH025]|uniref:hypothetical protein n=1 Tax=Streptomyces sp. FH025 TaxID=2815937 RepID=UPI001A9DB31C|nr:hypothetical protein [Streptomyces sp. FH025]MBO1417080.1 hypothetical protein [Streptomyces sp. FH025]
MLIPARSLTPARAHLGHAADPTGVGAGADPLLHLTDQPQRSATDPADLARHLAVPSVIDARDTPDAERRRAAGWTFRALGRP